MTNLIRNWRSKYIYLFFIKKNKIKLGPSRHTHKNNIYLTLKKKNWGTIGFAIGWGWWI